MILLMNTYLSTFICVFNVFLTLCVCEWSSVFLYVGTPLSLHLSSLLYLDTFVFLHLCVCVVVCTVFGYFCISALVCVWSSALYLDTSVFMHLCVCLWSSVLYLDTSVFLHLCVCGLLYCNWILLYFCTCVCGLLYCISCFSDNLTPLLCGHHLTVEPTARQIQIRLHIQLKIQIHIKNHLQI